MEFENGVSIGFNLVSKLRSCSVTATDIVGAGFILIIPDAGEKAGRSDRWGRGNSNKGIAVNCVYGIRCLIKHKKKDERHYEFNKLADEV